MCGIYCIESLIDGKKYIGQSVNIEKRFRQHKNILNSQTKQHRNIHLQRAWDKYGEENFAFYVVEECEVNNLDDREQYWSEFYEVYDMNKGYALKIAGQGIGNKIISEEIKQKMKDNHSDVTGINNPNRKPVLQYSLDGELLHTYNYIREASYDTGVNEDAISACCNKKIRATGGFIWRFDTDPLVNYNKTEYFKAKNGKRIIQYNVDGTTLNIYDSVVDASIATGINYDGIRNACYGKSKTSGGFIWRYEDDKLTNEDITMLNNNPIKIQEKKVQVAQYTKDGQFVKVWESMTQAGRELGIAESHISQCVAGIKKSIGGFVWKRYKEDKQTSLATIQN